MTGGSRGIGAATALRLARDGADVAVTYVNGKEEAEDVVRRVGALGRRALAVRSTPPTPVRRRTPSIAWPGTSAPWTCW